MIDAPSTNPAPEPTAEFDLYSAVVPFAGTPPNAWRDLPWSLVRSGTNVMALRLDRIREEYLADPANREIVMACGAALENLRVAAHHFGVALDVHRWPSADDDTVVAHLSAGTGQTPSREEEALFGVLTSAHHTPVRRVGGRLSPALIAVLRHAARTEGGWLDVVVDEARRQMVGDLESEAASIAHAERGAIRLLRDRFGADGDGIRFSTGGGPSLNELIAALGANVQPFNEWNSARTDSARGNAVDAPLLAVLGAGEDTPDSWLRAGEALQRVLLHASAQGLTASFLNEPLHHPLLRDALRTLLFASGTPHAILRFDFDANGSAHDRRHDFRRRVSAA